MIIKPYDADWHLSFHRLRVNVAELLDYIVPEGSAAATDATSAATLFNACAARALTLAEQLGTAAYKKMAATNWRRLRSALNVRADISSCATLEIDLPATNFPVAMLVGSSELTTATISAQSAEHFSKTNLSVRRAASGTIIQCVFSSLVSKYLLRASILRGRSYDACSQTDRNAIDEIDAWLSSISSAVGPYLLTPTDAAVVNTTGVTVAGYVPPTLTGVLAETSVQLSASDAAETAGLILTAAEEAASYLAEFSTRFLNGYAADAFKPLSAIDNSTPFARLAPAARVFYQLNEFESQMLTSTPDLLTYLAPDVERAQCAGLLLTPYQHVNMIYYYQRAQARLARAALDEWYPQVDSMRQIHTWADYIYHSFAESADMPYSVCVDACTLLFNDLLLDDDADELSATRLGCTVLRAFEARVLPEVEGLTASIADDTISLSIGDDTSVYRLRHGVFLTDGDADALQEVLTALRFLVSRVMAFACLADGSAKVDVRRVKHDEQLDAIVSATDDEPESFVTLISYTPSVHVFAAQLPGFALSESSLVTNML